jgi:hypothetical protein
MNKLLALIFVAASINPVLAGGAGGGSHAPLNGELSATEKAFAEKAPAVQAVRLTSEQKAFAAKAAVAVALVAVLVYGGVQLYQLHSANNALTASVEALTARLDAMQGFPERLGLAEQVFAGLGHLPAQVAQLMEQGAAIGLSNEALRQQVEAVAADLLQLRQPLGDAAAGAGAGVLPA